MGLNLSKMSLPLLFGPGYWWSLASITPSQRGYGGPPAHPLLPGIVQ